MATQTHHPELLTLREAANYLRVSVRTAYGLASTGDLPGAKVGGQWRIPRENLDALVGAERSAPSHEGNRAA